MQNNKAAQEFDKALLEGRIAWWQMYLPSGKVIFSDTKAEMIDRDPADFNHYEDFTSLLHPEDYEGAMQAMRDHLEGKKDIYETTYRIKKQDGSYARFYDFGKMIHQKDNDITIVGFVIKVAPQQNIKKQMKELKDLVTQGNPTILELMEDIQKNVK